MPRLVLVGGGHAHLTTIHAIPEFVARGHSVTVVQPHEHHYYSGMGPGMLGGAYTPEDIRFDTRHMVETLGGTFVEDRVTRADATAKRLELESGQSLEYDAVSFNVGSGVTGPDVSAAGPGYLPVKPIINLLEARERIRILAEHGGRVLVIGGGPAALEIAGNAWHAGKEFSAGRSGRGVRVTMLAGKHFLRGLKSRTKRLARASLAARGIEVLERGYVTAVIGTEVVFEDGARLDAELILGATGVRPPALLAESGLPTGASGGLLVDQYLRCPEHPEVFGGGDCIDFAPRQLDKVGVFAVRQNPVLKKNLLAALEGHKPEVFDPRGGYLLIYNMGDGRAVFQRGPLVFNGRLAFRLKDWIDRRFMRRFQALPQTSA